LLDTQAIALSLTLAFWTLVLLIPFGIWVAHRLADAGPWKSWAEAALALPLVLPPTVLGYYFINTWQRFRLIELPLAWRGILSGAAMTFAHTLGEFGVVLMVGGAIPGETKTASIAIYDKVQTFDTAGAGSLSLILLIISLIAIAVSYGVFGKPQTGSQRA